MGGYFGAASRRQVVLDVFFGVDYHSHLGTKSAGLAFWDKERGFRKDIHSISNTPFRTKFEKEIEDRYGTSGIGCINDSDPQPIIVRSRLGIFGILTTGIINNTEELVEKYLNKHNAILSWQSSGNINMTELVAALINEESSIEEGLKKAGELIDGSLTALILCDDGSIIASRDKLGRLPIHIGKDNDGYCVSFESFAYQKLGYVDVHELGPGEIVKITPDGWTELKAPGKKTKICSFLWSYYGYPSSTYNNVNVEAMRYKNGEIMARIEEQDMTMPEVDYVAGVPDSGIAHAMGYSAESGMPYARPLIKYTPTWPRSFMPENQSVRNQVARMKQIPVKELIDGKKLLFIDDSIVRGTQLRETVDFIKEMGAEEIHVRIACPPIMYACKYLNFSPGNDDMGLFARKVIQEIEGNEGQKHIEEYADGHTERGKCLLSKMAEKFKLDSLGFQTLDGLLEAIGIDKEMICTYCWTGKE
ncbi:MAG: amidophosphoribosyltransferase [Eubacteriales bacterium]|nr:amidophosphoribosyltransferase [Eubacteriales bacterium]